ncbi:MAG: DUF4954 domain-containing protein, partial [Sphaerochaeta sp.]
WTAESWKRRAKDSRYASKEQLEVFGRELLEERGEDVNSLMVTTLTLENSCEPVEILKPVEAYRSYTEMLLYYCTKAIASWCNSQQCTVSDFQKGHTQVREDWLNVGGQLVPLNRVEHLKEQLKTGELSSWDAVHQRYEEWFTVYPLDRANQALSILKEVLQVQHLTLEVWNTLVEGVVRIRSYIEDQVFKTKEKDFNNSFRDTTYRNHAERDAVLGCLDDNPFILESKQISEKIIEEVCSVVF